MTQHAHAEARGTHAGHLLAYASQPDHPQRPPEQLPPHQRVPLGKAPLAHAAVGAEEVAAHGQGQGENVLGHRAKVGPRGDQDGYATPRRRPYRNVVHADAVARDHPQPWRLLDLLGAERLRPHEERVHLRQQRVVQLARLGPEADRDLRVLAQQRQGLLVDGLLEVDPAAHTPAPDLWRRDRAILPWSGFARLISMILHKPGGRLRVNKGSTSPICRVKSPLFADRTATLAGARCSLRFSRSARTRSPGQPSPRCRIRGAVPALRGDGFERRRGQPGERARPRTPISSR